MTSMIYRRSGQNENMDTVGSQLKFESCVVVNFQCCSILLTLPFSPYRLIIARDVQQYYSSIEDEAVFSYETILSASCITLLLVEELQLQVQHKPCRSY